MRFFDADSARDVVVVKCRKEQGEWPVRVEAWPNNNPNCLTSLFFRSYFGEPIRELHVGSQSCAEFFLVVLRQLTGKKFKPVKHDIRGKEIIYWREDLIEAIDKQAAQLAAAH
jgi:hypothetical protein